MVAFLVLKTNQLTRRIETCREGNRATVLTAHDSSRSLPHGVQRTKLRCAFPTSQLCPESTHYSSRGSLPIPWRPPKQGPRGQAEGHQSGFHKLKEPRTWEAVAGDQHPKMAQVTAWSPQQGLLSTRFLGYNHDHCWAFRGAAGLAPHELSGTSLCLLWFPLGYGLGTECV